MIRFLCPGCRTVLEQPEAAGGNKFTCPECGQNMKVPPAPENKSAPGVTSSPPAKAPDAIPVHGQAATSSQNTGITIKHVLEREHLFWPCPFCRAEVDIPIDLGQLAVRCPSCARKIDVPYPAGVTPRQSRRAEPAAVPACLADLEDIPVLELAEDEERPHRREPAFGFRHRPERTRSNAEAARRGAVSGLVCSLISLGLLVLTFLIWATTLNMPRLPATILFVLLVVLGASLTLGILGTAFSSRGLDPHNYHNRGAALAGLICGIISIVISSMILLILLVSLLFWAGRGTRRW